VFLADVRKTKLIIPNTFVGAEELQRSAKIQGRQPPFNDPSERGASGGSNRRRRAALVWCMRRRGRVKKLGRMSWIGDSGLIPSMPGLYELHGTPEPFRDIVAQLAY